jgi:hypothetical protein
MTEQGDTSDWKSSARGDFAWKKTREQVAARNEEVRKAGKRRREAYERERERVRQTAAARSRALLLNRRTP